MLVVVSMISVVFEGLVMRMLVLSVVFVCMCISCKSILVIIVLSSSMLVVVSRIWLRFFYSMCKLMFMLMVIRNMLSVRFLNGLVIVLILFWYLVLVISSFVISVLIIGERLVFVVVSVVVIIVSRLVVRNILGFLVCVVWVKMCGSRKCLLISSSMMIISFSYSVWNRFFSFFDVVNGVSVLSRKMIGISVIFLNSSIDSVVLLIGVCWLVICSISVVEDIVSVSLIVSVLFGCWLVVVRKLVSVVVMMISLSELSLKIICCICYSWLNDSFSLIENSSRMMLNLVKGLSFFGLVMVMW